MSEIRKVLVSGPDHSYTEHFVDCIKVAYNPYTEQYSEYVDYDHLGPEEVMVKRWVAV